MFTVNNPFFEDDEGNVFPMLLVPGAWPADDVQFVVWQLERGEQNGVLHYQGYLQLKRKRTINQLHSWTGLERAHFEVTRGTPTEAKDYCEKEETRVDGPFYWPSVEAFVDYKENQKRTVRTDLLDVRKRVLDGASLRDIVMEEDLFGTFVKFHKGIQVAMVHMARPRQSLTVGLVLYGSSGAGKSTTARALARALSPTGKDPFFLSMEKSSGIYFDGYSGGQVVVVDEMDGSRFSPKFLNELLDEHPFNVPVHGGSAVFNSKFVIFTTNVHPSQWWPRQRVRAATMRRLVVFPTFTRHVRELWGCGCSLEGGVCKRDNLPLPWWKVPVPPPPAQVEWNRRRRLFDEAQDQRRDADRHIEELVLEQERATGVFAMEIDPPVRQFDPDGRRRAEDTDQQTFFMTDDPFFNFF